MPAMPMELEVAESLIDEIPGDRWDALMRGREKPTIDEARALRVIWDAGIVEGRVEPSAELRVSVMELTGAFPELTSFH